MEFRVPPEPRKTLPSSLKQQHKHEAAEGSPGTFL